MALYKKELGRILKSLLYLLMAAAVVLFVYSQNSFPPGSRLSEPAPGQADYGTKASNDPGLIMPEAAESLYSQFLSNQYVTYPNGFIKYVKLSQSDRDKMDAILRELGLVESAGASPESEAPPSEDVKIQIDGSDMQIGQEGNVTITRPDTARATSFTLRADITWERFSELMAEADGLLGGGSDYSQTWISHRFGKIPVTYEEALAEYRLVVSEDRMTGAHARLFSDYTGVIMGLLPVFPAVFLFLRDRKSIASSLYTRRVSSAKLVLSRYLALVTAVMLPVLLMSLISTVVLGADYGWANIDALAYFKYAFGWILPTVLASAAVGTFFTTLTGTPIAIAVQLGWWFIDAVGGNSAYSFFGTRPLQLMPRHNSLGKQSLFAEYLPALTQNRIIIASIAVILVVLTILAFDAKRKGWLDVSVFKRREIQSEV